MGFTANLRKIYRYHPFLQSFLLFNVLKLLHELMRLFDDELTSMFIGSTPVKLVSQIAKVVAQRHVVYERFEKRLHEP